MTQETPAKTNETASTPDTDETENQISAEETPERKALAYPDFSTSLDKINYSPLSPLAIIGLGLAGLYALIVIYAVLFGFLSGATVFLPLWLFILPIGACVLCVVAQRQIKNSEGTMAGEPLAMWGLYLSILTGLGYGAYYFATSLAVRQQAHSFLMTENEDSGFLKHLVKGKMKKAFLLTFPWDRRHNVDIKNRKEWDLTINHLVKKGEPKGAYDNFRENPMIQLLALADPDTIEITSRGVESWKYEKGQYEVKRTYSIKTHLAELNITIQLQSTSSDAPGQPRKWFVKLPIQPASDKPYQPTPRGKSLQALGSHSHAFLDKLWFPMLSLGKLKGPAPKDLTPWNQIAIPKTAMMEAKNFLAGEAPGQRQVKLAERGLMFPKFDDRGPNIRVVQPFAFTVLQSLGAKRDMQLWVIGRLTLESLDPLELVDSGELNLRGVGWKAVSFEIERFVEVPLDQPGQGPGMRG